MAEEICPVFLTNNGGRAVTQDNGQPFPTVPFYNGNPEWVLPLVGAWYRTRDWWDRKTAA